MLLLLFEWCRFWYWLTGGGWIYKCSVMCGVERAYPTHCKPFQLYGGVFYMWGPAATARSHTMGFIFETNNQKIVEYVSMGPGLVVGGKFWKIFWKIYHSKSALSWNFFSKPLYCTVPAWCHIADDIIHKVSFWVSKILNTCHAFS